MIETAGRAALEAQAAPRNRYQIRVQLPIWDTAEQTAATFAKAIRILQLRETVTYQKCSVS